MVAPEAHRGIYFPTSRHFCGTNAAFGRASTRAGAESPCRKPCCLRTGRSSGVTWPG